MHVRAGEKPKTWYRSDRYFVIDNQWFFTTREGVDVGPYGDRNSAQEGLDVFLKCVSENNCSPELARDLAIKGVWGTVYFM